MDREAVPHQYQRLIVVAPLHGAMLQLPPKPGVFDTPANDEYDPVGVGPHTNSRSTFLWGLGPASSSAVAERSRGLIAY